MLQGAFLEIDKTVFLQKKMLQKWLDNGYSRTQNMLPRINMDN